MTTAPAKTETYTLLYVVELPHVVTIQAPAGLSPSDVELLVTGDDLANGNLDVEAAWDKIKEAELRCVTTEAGDKTWLE